MNNVTPACSHRLENGKTARQSPLYHCATCGKPPAILGVLPYTKAEQATLDARKAQREAEKVTA